MAVLDVSFDFFIPFPILDWRQYSYFYVEYTLFTCIYLIFLHYIIYPSRCNPIRMIKCQLLIPNNLLPYGSNYYTTDQNLIQIFSLWSSSMTLVFVIPVDMMCCYIFKILHFYVIISNPIVSISTYLYFLIHNIGTSNLSQEQVFKITHCQSNLIPYTYIYIIYIRGWLTNKIWILHIYWDITNCFEHVLS